MTRSNALPTTGVPLHFVAGYCRVFLCRWDERAGLKVSFVQKHWANLCNDRCLQGAGKFKINFLEFLSKILYIL